MPVHRSSTGLFDEKELGSLLHFVTMERLRFFSTLCFAAAAVFHLLTFSDKDYSDIYGWAGLLHVCALAAVFMMIGVMTKRGERQDKFWPRFLGTRRGLTKWAGIFVIIYGLASLPVMVQLMDGKTASEVPSGCILSDEDGNTEKVSPEVCSRYRAWDARMFSGIWLIFFFFPMIYAWQVDDMRYISENILMEYDNPPDE